jgi:signal transduction histidine kinase
VRDYEVLLKRKDGELLNALVTATAVRDETGKVVSYRGISRDITPQRRLEEFNQAMETIVAERTMNLMALTLADRVRNPATIIAWMSKKMMGKGIPEDMKKSVSATKDEAEKLEAIVKEFQQTLGIRRSVFVYENVNDLVINIISIIGEEANRKGIKLVSDISEEPLKTNMQRDLFRVAVLHIVRNAMEATPSGGEISVKTFAEDDNVVLSVSDTGRGIPKDDIERIFDPLFSTKMHRYGMGLPLVKQIVSEHMGEISVESKPGKGTVVRMVFPARWL